MALDKSRRSILKAASAGIATGLAGCTNAGSGGSGQGSGESTGSSSGKRFDGVTIEYWDWLQSQSRPIKQFTQNVIKQFENDTGATIKWNQSNWTQMTQQWPTAVQNGSIPSFTNLDVSLSNKIARKYWYVHDNLIKDYPSLYENVNLDPFKASMDKAKFQMRGWPDIDHITVPQFQVPRYGMAWRMDYWEQAGIMDQFPPTNLDELIEAAKTLQEKTDAESGFAIAGAAGENESWMAPRSSHIGDGRMGSEYFNENYSDLKIDGEVFTQAWRENKRMQDAGILPENTTALSDERALQLTAGGKYAGCISSLMSHSILTEQNPEAVKNGTIQWKSFADWETNSGNIDQVWPGGNIVGKKPDGGKKWDRRAEASTYFLTNYWYTKDLQKSLPTETGGWWPTRSDVFDKAEQAISNNDSHNWGTALRSGIEQSDDPDLSWGSPDPDINDFIVRSVSANPWQKMMKGELSPSEATKAWYDEAANAVNL